MGTRKSSATFMIIQRDHPHAYGDKSLQCCTRITIWGSSPRVWGQATAILSQFAFIRIIPTRMGTSLRGDGWVLERNGSSPRVWGQVSDKSTLKSVSRIIPTRMGTSLRQIHAKICVKDHPHAYGDKKLSYRFHKKGVGSSPRVWGQEQEHAQHLCLLWIIPTRMGTSRAVQREECAG